MRVATKYPRIAARHLEQTGRQAEIVEVKGSVELAPLTGMVEAIVDLTATGTTLRENNLVVREEIVVCTARLIANPVAHKLKAAAIDELLEQRAQRPVPPPASADDARCSGSAIDDVSGLGGPPAAARHVRSLVPGRRVGRSRRRRRDRRRRPRRAATRRVRRADTRGFDTGRRASPQRCSS